MAITQTDIDYILELFEPVAAITYRKMMGGLTIYSAEAIFAVYAPDDGVYLKVDDVNRADYEAEGLQAFSFEMNGKKGTMSYYQLPERCYDDAEELEIWARKAIDAGLRAKVKKKPRKKSVKKKK
jgi:DNA transformation protein